MKKELKQILFICAFFLIGCVLGYFTAVHQMKQLSDPEYIAFWAGQNMAVPEPLGLTRSILSFGLLFSGIPTGLIFYHGIARKWLTPIAPKIIIGFAAFPIYTLAGVVGSIPFMIYRGISLFRNSSYHSMKKLNHVLLLLLMFTIFFGVSLSAGENQFYNTLFMPAAGVLGYAVYRKRALYLLPCFVAAVSLLYNLLNFLLGAEYLDIASLLMWSLLYSILALLGTVTALLLHSAFRKEGAALKIPAGAAGVLLLLCLCWFANVMVGNPLSRALARRTAEGHLGECYANTDFFIEKVNYSFKDGSYYAYIKSPSSMDSSFTLYLSMTGKLEYDSYADRVLSGSNTADRLNGAYRALTDAILESPSFPYSSPIAFGNLMFGDFLEADQQDSFSGLPLSSLETDKIYNLPALGAQAGHLVLYVEEETVSVQRLAEILLDIRQRFDDAGIPFFSIDLALRQPRTEEEVSQKEERLEVMGFPYSGIRKEGLTQRVTAACEEAAAYHAQQDREKAAQTP